MVSLLKWLVLIPIGAVIIVFALANRAPVQLELDPLGLLGGGLPLSLPLFLLVFASLGVGVVIGGIAVWLAQGRYRRAARLAAREADRQRAEVERLRQQGSGSTLPAMSAIR